MLFCLPIFINSRIREVCVLINKYSNIPLYSQLKDLLIKKIETGEYPENSQIPSEQELCDTYDISRPTVRQAISELTNNGYLYKEKGRGTFVAKSRTRVDVRNYSGFSDSILDSQIPGERNILDIRVVSSREYEKLNEVFTNLQSMGPDLQFAEITYLTSSGSEIISLNVSYLPLILFPGIIEDVRSRKPSYDILRGKYPLIPVRSKSVLEVVYTGLTDAQHLQMQPGHALIKVTNVLYSKNGQAVEYVISKFRADKCQLVFENAKS